MIGDIFMVLLVAFLAFGGAMQLLESLNRSLLSRDLTYFVVVCVDVTACVIIALAAQPNTFRYSIPETFGWALLITIIPVLAATRLSLGRPPKRPR